MIWGGDGGKFENEFIAIFVIMRPPPQNPLPSCMALIFAIKVSSLLKGQFIGVGNCRVLHYSTK